MTAFPLSLTGSIRSPLWMRLLVCLGLVAATAYLRLSVYPNEYVPLTYALPLLVWLWLRDITLLWVMAVLFVTMTIYKGALLLNGVAEYTLSERIMFSGMQVANILLTTGVVHAVVRLSSRLEATIAQVERSNAELEASNEELAAHEEEISQQNEELQTQAAELEQQTEELSTQTEELQTLNEQLAARERSLNDLLEVSVLQSSESEMLACLGDSIEKLIGGRATAAAIVQPRGDSMDIRPLFGVAATPSRMRRSQTLADLVISRDRAGFLADMALRPDLESPTLSSGVSIRSIVAAPMRISEAASGALEVYSDQPGEWSEGDLRLLQWFAEQCGRMWTLTRLRAEVDRQRGLLRTVTDNSTIAHFMTDDRGNCTFINPAAQAMLGWEGEDPRNLPLYEITGHRRSRGSAFPAADSPLEVALVENRPVRDHLDTFTRKGGETFPVRCTVTPVIENGKPLYAVIEVHDITQQRRHEEEREHLLEGERAARAESERAGRAKDEFVATLSHELRTPLNAILGWATLLRKNLNDPSEVIKGLEVIERNARQQGQLISDLLDISRITAGKVRLDVQAVDLPLVIEGALESIRPASDAKGLKLVRVVEPVDRVVTGDPGRLQQIVWNLLSNAVKFTPRGGTIQVVLSRVASYVQIAITDTGPGIEPDLLPQLFERYRQGDSSSTRRTGGLGLGLSIVKHLVELHGGSVHVRSEGAGKGSVFSVLLPVRAVETAADETEPHPETSGTTPVDPGFPSFANTSILVVDDEEDARALISRLLGDCGATVTCAPNAEEALRVVADRKPNVIVSDIGMPGMDGYTLIRELRARHPGSARDMPAIALTAFARSEDRTRALLAGFQSHIAKPVEPAELIATVASMVATLGIRDGSPN